MVGLCVLATLALLTVLVVSSLRRPSGKTAPTATGDREPTATSLSPITRTVLLPRGSTVHVVGESHYQPALERLAGGRSDESVRVDVVATLKREPDNRYDTNAVVVLIEGRQVGYLSREDAPVFQPLLKEMEARGEVATCSAVIVGGWDRGARGKGSFGVRLRLARPGQAPAASPPPPSDAELVSSAVERMWMAKGPAGRRAALKAVLDKLTTEEARQELLAEASLIEVTAALEKAASLKTATAKRRRLEEALATLRADSVPDELQQQQVAWLEAALRELDAPHASENNNLDGSGGEQGTTGQTSAPPPGEESLK
ncbi:HIRAN domain-containing protein [Vitiosangium sp. GDMCC 1.1324]|uniref:HIRAN domain-containing protein n=1 Tax=Vitiosangium sp. (strain GDMCC 1.1324) TaxID=2138576 RepID=UPI000D3B1FA5|nr:HIRAN domain-containing protein [Vitiosangium sp. GDMCC 1.1324]PTL78675.1 hypothetical protein DAT35_37015 [Vitiosangium sp. GDMCC 1.1324]